MPALHIRNVDDAVVAALKERARRNNRSLEGELREILRDAACPRGSAGKRAKARHRPELRLETVAVATASGYGREEIYREDDR